jgi:hypothetical protein
MAGGCEEVCLEIAHLFLMKPQEGIGCHLPFEKGTRWAGILVARNNAQGCSSINQIPVIGLFVR